MRRVLAVVTLAACTAAFPLLSPVRSGADAGAPEPLPSEAAGSILAAPPLAPHQAWIADFVLERTAGFDGDSGQVLGMLSTGVGAISPVFSQARNEIYLPETYYSRGSRGERTDVVTIYDATTLAPISEVPLPPKRADIVHAMALSTLLDDGRFLALANLTPATSVTIVDVEERRLVGEIATPGCHLVYAAGPRRFFSLCGDGALLLVALDAQGAEQSRARSEPFFDVLGDPVTEKAVRHGDEWIFVSFDGLVRTVDISGETPHFAEPWSVCCTSESRRRARCCWAAARRSVTLPHRGPAAISSGDPCSWGAAATGVERCCCSSRRAAPSASRCSPSCGASPSRKPSGCAWSSQATASPRRSVALPSESNSTRSPTSSRPSSASRTASAGCPTRC